MRKILLFLLVILSFQAFGQTPPGYQTRIVRERIQGSFMVDSALHIPRYNGTPVGVRVGSSVQDGAIAMDTLNHLFYYYSGGTWRLISGNNIYNSNGILDANRTLTGLNNTYSLHLDSLIGFRAGRNGVVRFYFDATTSSMISQNTNAAVTVNPTQAIVNYQGNALRVAVDSSTITKILSYETNINGSLTPNAHATKSYVDSVAAASGVNIYNTSSRLTGNRVLGGAGFNLQIGDSIPSLSFFSGNDFTSLGVGGAFQMSDTVLSIQASSLSDFSTIGVSPTHIKFIAPDGSGSTGDVWTNLGSGNGHWAAGGGGVTSVGSGFGTNFSTITSTGSVVVDSTSGGMTSWVRTKKIIDSLTAAGWGNSLPNSEPWYRVIDEMQGVNLHTLFQQQITGTAAAINGLSVADATPDGWVFGLKLDCGTASNGKALLYAPVTSGGNYAATSIVSTTRTNVGFKVRLEDLSNGTDTYETHAGASNDANLVSAITEGIYFRYTDADSSGKWIAVCEHSNTKTEVQTSVTVAADTDYTLEWTAFGGSVLFYINKALVATISTNLPTSTSLISPNMNIYKTAGTTARILYCDWGAIGTKTN